ncbi:MAG TPA: hypothetical protein VN203_04775, partial [Candidatus Acidoferrum sp.]|nr:hypothetical protein [Candidatus Acidoferrum sp.]
MREVMGCLLARPEYPRCLFHQAWDPFPRHCGNGNQGDVARTARGPKMNQPILVREINFIS